ncbi:MAG: anhydro-N-acetylmuramic acid kinase [Rhodanobacteraceae bacterium]
MAPTPAYLGLISGTSADGIDSALVTFEPVVRIVAAHTTPYPDALRSRLLALTRSTAAIALDDLGELDVTIGERFAKAALDLLDQAGVGRDTVAAIGSHGQTVRHRPKGHHPFTLQIGDPSVIAERTGIRTIGDFRRADVAAGGQGAPLMPAFHRAVFARPDATRVVLNLGGIANITVLDPDQPIFGFDTGPANCLLDAWAQRHNGTRCDHEGAWAESGQLNRDLLERWLDDPYFAEAPPKSTGREVFNLEWLERNLIASVTPADVQATLLALSVHTIADSVRQYAPATVELLVCGGGAHNMALMRGLTTQMKPIEVRSTADFAIDPDHVEAAGFAWLARERLAGRPGNLPSVTGARGLRELGAIYAAP